MWFSSVKNESVKNTCKSFLNHFGVNHSNWFTNSFVNQPGKFLKSTKDFSLLFLNSLYINIKIYFLIKQTFLYIQDLFYGNKAKTTESLPHIHTAILKTRPKTHTPHKYPFPIALLLALPRIWSLRMLFPDKLLKDYSSYPIWVV